MEKQSDVSLHFVLICLPPKKIEKKQMSMNCAIDYIYYNLRGDSYLWFSTVGLIYNTKLYSQECFCEKILIIEHWYLTRILQSIICNIKFKYYFVEFYVSNCPNKCKCCLIVVSMLYYKTFQGRVSLAE
jgi:hypothetical protein